MLGRIYRHKICLYVCAETGGRFPSDGHSKVVEVVMRKFLSLIPAVGAVLAMSHAHAAPVVIDTFGGPGMFVADTTINGVGVSVGPVGPVNPPANTLSRTVTHDFLAGTNAAGTASNVAIGSQTSPAGAFSVFNDVDRDSRVTLAWTLPAGFVPNSAVGAYSWEFALLLASVDVSFQLFYNNVLFTADVLLAYDGMSGPVSRSFALSDAQQNAISGGVGTQELRVVFNGPVGWDLKLDSFGLREGTTVNPVPEPSTLALVGLAVAGLGLASRRRKSA
jgi:hypothetical protein